MSAPWLNRVRTAVDSHLGRFFDEKHTQAHEISRESVELVEAVRALTERGGKRLRPALLCASYRAFRPSDDFGPLLDAAAALELLQSYLLIHDDWMDGDDTRRGGPSVHAALGAARNNRALGERLGVLAGDLASVYAWELFLRARFPKECESLGHATFIEIHYEVFFGQHLDLIASPDVARMHRLKTGSYTTCGPVKLGALLAGASQAELAALKAFSAPLGQAFQLRDDLLGAFGDPAVTGKPVGHDIREGKRNAVIEHAEKILNNDERAFLASVVGTSNDELIHKALDLLHRRGVKEHVDAQVEQLKSEALSALSRDALQQRATGELRTLAELLVNRAS